MRPDKYHMDLLEHWIRERENIRLKREANFPKPWTDDPILQKYHFCNVRRQDDRGTKEIQEIGHRVGVDRLPWFYTMARLLNYAPSVEIVEKCKNQPPQSLINQLQAQKKIFHTAYVVSTCGKKMNKVEYVVGLGEQVKKLDLRTNSCLMAFKQLNTIGGMGSFLSGQVIADLKNDRYLTTAADKKTFAVMGPGSRKGLNYIYGGGTTMSNFYSRLNTVRVELYNRSVPLPDMQDLQNCMCEFSKYMRHKNGERGRVRYYV